MGFLLVAAGGVVAKLVSGTSPDLTGGMSLAMGRPIVSAARMGLLETAVGAALTLNLGSAVQTSGFLVYATVT